MKVNKVIKVSKPLNGPLTDDCWLAYRAHFKRTPMSITDQSQNENSNVHLKCTKKP